MHIIEVSDPDAEHYYKISDRQLARIIKLTPFKASRFIRKNCKAARISSTDEADLGFAENTPAKGPNSWEWKEFCDEVKDYLES